MAFPESQLWLCLVSHPAHSWDVAPGFFPVSTASKHPGHCDTAAPGNERCKFPLGFPGARASPQSEIRSPLSGMIPLSQRSHRISPSVTDISPCRYFPMDPPRFGVHGDHGFPWAARIAGSAGGLLRPRPPPQLPLRTRG